MKKRYKFFLGLLCLFFFGIWICDYVIKTAAEGKTFSDVHKIPKNKVGMVLGTSKNRIDGSQNLYYKYRIAATISLFKAEKIKFVLVSGDNGSKYYNEPITFKKDLIAAGIPEEKIFLDYAGFRTLDSMFRAKEIFGLDSVTVISQKFHNERAIFLAQKKELMAIGYNAQDVHGKSGLKIQFREYLARVKALIDVLLNKEPKFYGNSVEIK